MESSPGGTAGTSLCEADVGTQSGSIGEPAQGQGGEQALHLKERKVAKLKS